MMRISGVRGLEYSVIAGNEDEEYSCFVNDTRKIKDGCLFICIKGANFDPHDDIEAIRKKGAAGIIIEHDCVFPEGINVYRVENSRRAESLCAAAFFGYPADRLIKIAVTGTKGKTTTAAMIRTLLEKSGRKTGVIGTLGIETDGKLTPTVNTTPGAYDIQKAFADMVNAGCGYAVMEVSSQAVIMHRVDGIEFDYGVFTNISSDHIGPGEHASFEEYLDCKTEIISRCRKALVNADDAHADYVIAHSGCREIRTFGLKEDADFRLGKVRCVSDPDFIGIEAECCIEGMFRCRVGIPGEFNAHNALGAAAVCYMAGTGKEILSDGLKELHVNGRMELVYSDENLKVIVDFAHNEVSMRELLLTLRNYEHRRLVVVFGCGGNRSKERRYGMGRAAGEMSDFAILTEDNNRLEDIRDILADIRTTFDQGTADCIEIPLRPDAVRYAIEHHQPGDIVAIIGKGHEDYIDKGGVRTHYTDQEAVAEAVEYCRNRGILC